MRFNPLIVALIGLGFASCAGPSASKRLPSCNDVPVGTSCVTADGWTILCKKEVPTGSHIGEMVCRREARTQDVDNKLLQHDIEVLSRQQGSGTKP